MEIDTPAYNSDASNFNNSPPFNRIYTVKVFKDGKLSKSSRTSKWRRFYHFLRTIKFQSGSATVIYIKVDYGKHLDNFGKMSKSVNEGSYTNNRELMQAARTFNEP